MPRGLTIYDDVKSQGELWTPAVRSGQVLELWFDAMDRATLSFASGNSVNGMKDKSGKGNHHTLQSTSTLQPTFVPMGMLGMPSISYNDDKLEGPFVFTGSVLGVYAAGTIASTVGNNGRLVSCSVSAQNDWDSDQRFSVARSESNQLVQIYRNGAASLSVPTYDLPSVFTAYNSGSTVQMGINGSHAASSAKTGAMNTTLCAIGRGVNSTEYWVGYLNEVIFDSGPYSTYRRDKIEGYLAWKWGFQKNLVGGHPFKNRPPMLGD